jgi:hypothetical protein
MSGIALRVGSIGIMAARTLLSSRLIAPEERQTRVATDLTEHLSSRIVMSTARY